MKYAKKIAFLGIMLALIIVLTIFENMLPPIPLLPPNIKIGLSNIIIMYLVFFTGYREAILLNVLKSLFVFVTRGGMSGILSFSGGMVSVIIIIILILIFKDNISYIAVSIAGAISHNFAQLLVYSLIMSTNLLVIHLPALLVFGIIVGAATGFLLQKLLPVLNKLEKL